MSVYNGAVQLSQITGGWLYDQLGFARVILISAAFTALCWLLVPLLNLADLEGERKADPSWAPTEELKILTFPFTMVLS
jgi:nitrate/nitrite transporter NarK